MSILKGSRDLISALPLRDLKGMPPSIELPANFAKIHSRALSAARWCAGRVLAKKLIGG
jgi:hypothetical protein